MQVLSKIPMPPLGTLHSLNEINNNLRVEQCSKEELKNLVIHNLTNFSDDIANTSSRCVILCTLTCFIYEEILNQRWHPRLNDAIKRVFKDLDFREVDQTILIINSLSMSSYEKNIFICKAIQSSPCQDELWQFKIPVYSGQFNFSIWNSICNQYNQCLFNSNQAFNYK